MIRFFLDIVIILICFLFQQTFFQALSLGGIVPNILLIICSCYGFVAGKREAMYIGFVSGMLVDIFYGSILGVNAIIYMIIGYSNGYYKGGFFPDDIKMPMLLIAVSDMAYSVMFYVVNFMLRGRNMVFGYLKEVAIPELFYTLLLAFIIYRPLYFVLKLTEEKESDI